MARAILAAFALGLLLPGGPAAAEDHAPRFVPEVSFAPAAPNIGDQVMLRVALKVPENLLVTFPRLDRELGGFALSGRLAPPPEAGADDTSEWVQFYRFEPEATGALTIPALAIVVHDPKTLESVTVTAPATAIRVASVVAEGADLRHARPPRGPVALAVPAGWPAIWLAAAALALALGGALVWRRRRPAAPPPAAAVAPRAAALGALGTLDPAADGASASERFHTVLAEALRRFLDDALAIAAPRRTTDELLGQAARAETVPGLAALASGPLAQCDRVKFARQLPDEAARRAALSAAIGFVERAGAPGPG